MTGNSARLDSAMRRVLFSFLRFSRGDCTVLKLLSKINYPASDRERLLDCLITRRAVYSVLHPNLDLTMSSVR